MREIEGLGVFYLGRTLDASDEPGGPLLLDARDLTTHAVIIGMTGSGKTGLGIALLEEAALDGIPALAIDPKGDLGNLALAFPQLRPADFEPWIDPEEARRAGQTPAEAAAATAERWRQGLRETGQDEARIARFKSAAEVVLFTPGSRAGTPLSVLRSFAAPPAALLADPDGLRERAAAAVSGLLALLGRAADPLRSREHILLSRIVGEAWERGADLDLQGLIRGLESPPFSRVGALELESFLPEKDRFELASALNNLLASPAFAPWLEGEPLDVGRLLRAPDGRPRLSVLSIAHLGDAERMFFVTLLLNEVVAWMRAQPGTQTLRALLYMDEVFGYLPPTAQPAVEDAAPDAPEAGPGVRPRRRAGDAEPGRPRLQGALERGHLVPRAPADRARPQPRGRGPRERRRRRRAPPRRARAAARRPRAARPSWRGAFATTSRFASGPASPCPTSAAR